MSPVATRRLVRWTHRSADTSAAEEFRYLDAFLDRQISLATVGREVAPAHDLDSADSAELVVRLGSDRVLFTAATLGAMLDAIDAGADVVLASPLAAAAGAAAAEVYTLAGYEAVENGVLSPATVVEEPGAAPCPALSLWRMSAFRSAGADSAEASIPGGVVRAHCGVFHEFIDYYGEVRADVLPFVPEGSRDVLEVGCARGLTGALIQESLGCRVTGVDLNPVVAEEARGRLHAVHCGDIEELELTGSFDAVVALELFEHLRDPIAFVRRMLGFLRPSGRVVMSTPNVGHYSIVGDLVAGRWDYVPVGLLCYTHLRFFTAATLADWLAMAGCGSVEIVRQHTELPESVAAWARTVPGADLESLATKGFWVIAGR